MPITITKIPRDLGGCTPQNPNIRHLSQLDMAVVNVELVGQWGLLLDVIQTVPCLENFAQCLVSASVLVGVR